MPPRLILFLPPTTIIIIIIILAPSSPQRAAVQTKALRLHHLCNAAPHPLGCAVAIAVLRPQTITGIDQAAAPRADRHGGGGRDEVT
ncbi:hypothetical protein EYF80_060377 [Liparis tanakae]|uniref:Uncharacterized protein n=1 Tax=Liparis tanakae TaxID=230148 RepID=A0A4Z2EM08_9TELE|nr:hypothetical protein EYF80_060377 [Liparis tanakae]